MEIEVYSDVICPWCLAGKRRLEKALAATGLAGEASVTWRPFELNPGMPIEGMERKKYRTAKFGNLEISQSMDARLIAVGREEGIPFAFDRIERTPNTFEAHRLLWFAQQEGLQSLLMEALFRGYFLEGQNVGDRSVLTAIAAGVGLDAGKFLGGSGGTEEVRQEEQRARELGINAVPHFILNRRWQLSGAQPPDVMADALRQAVATAAV